jgi:hypothetical protein
MIRMGTGHTLSFCMEEGKQYVPVRNADAALELVKIQTLES